MRRFSIAAHSALLSAPLSALWAGQILSALLAICVRSCIGRCSPREPFCAKQDVQYHRKHHRPRKQAHQSRNKLLAMRHWFILMGGGIAHGDDAP
jgi:hypothetical protein